MHEQKTAIVNEFGHKTSQFDRSNVTFDPKIFSSVTPDIFDGDYWAGKNAILGQALGRGVTWFVKHEEHDLVLRHYYRGGLVGKFLNDEYLFVNQTKTRAFQEYFLLARLHDLALPVPQPAAFHVRRSQFYYTCDIITTRIKNSRSLVDILKTQELDTPLWRRVGETIKTFHDNSVHHHDLNAHNILIDDNEAVWLIDFDQGSIRQNGSWKQQNLDRLLRSLRKELDREAHFNWRENHWDKLISAYHS